MYLAIATDTVCVCMQTSDVKGAGTNARVKLQIFGVSSGKAIKLPPQQEGFSLDKSSDNFERGKYEPN